MADIKTYTVVTDSHGYPFAMHGADFDLGDNTEASTTYPTDIVHSTGALHMTLYGNHDVYARKKNNSGYTPYEDIFSINSTTYRVVFYGLDTSFYDPENGMDGQHKASNLIPIDQIQEMADDLYQKANSNQTWYVIVLTHIPLFPGIGDYSWPSEPAEKQPINYNWVISLLKAYRDGGTVLGHTFAPGGNVIGCFCGHTHSNIQYASSNDHIYMESLQATGGATATSSQSIKDAGLYNRPSNSITINFTDRKVNGHTFDSPTIEPANVVYSNLTNSRKNITSGMFKLDSNSYPKFCTDGKYLGYSSSSESGCDYNYNSHWNVNTTIYCGNTVIPTTKILFSPDGKLSSCYTNGNFEFIPNYSTANFHFVANGKRWEFSNGLYVFDKSKAYKFNNNSLYYPGFDADGRYLGWSNGPNKLLTGARDSTTSSRSFTLVSTGTTRLYVNHIHVAAVINIIFDTNGILTSFERNNGTYYTDVSGLVEIIGGSAKWIFNNGLLTSIEAGGKIWAYYNCTNQLMKFTNTQYYMYFTNGYLTGYRYMSDPASTIRNDDIDTNWTCRKEVKYYANEVDAYYNRNVQYSFTTPFLTFTSTDNTNHYISNLNNSYSYARIDNGSDKYYFKKISTNKWILVDIYGG